MKTKSQVFFLCLDVNIFPLSKFQSLGKLWNGKLNKDKWILFCCIISSDRETWLESILKDTLEKLLLTSNRTNADESKNVLLLAFRGNSIIFLANMMGLTIYSWIIEKSSAFSDDRDFQKKLSHGDKIRCMWMTTLNYNYMIPFSLFSAFIKLVISHSVTV